MELNVLRSGRQLVDELTGIRIAAVDTSIWSIVTTVRERARLAINDALQTYPIPISRVFNSLSLPDTGIYVLPAEVDRITNIIAVTSSGSTSKFVTGFRHIPTEQTNLIEVKVTGAVVARVEYESRVTELPSDLLQKSGSDLTTGSLTLTVSKPMFEVWPRQGYIELTPMAATISRELVYYNSLAPTGNFYLTSRGAGGTSAQAWTASHSIRVSPVVMMPPQGLAVIMKGAEGNMYSYWAGHRAMYDQYVAIVGESGMDVTDVLALVRVFENQADVRYTRIKRPPGPARVQSGKRKDTGL